MQSAGPQLSGKNVLVAGLGPAIGAHVAEAFLSTGANVFVVARSADHVAAFVDRVRSDTGIAAGCAADLATSEGVRSAVRLAEDAFGSIDVLVYNAYALDSGHSKTFSYASLFEADDDDWETCFQVNVAAPYRLAKLLVPRMQERGGVIINMVAAAAFTPIMPAVAYGCTKAALVTLTRYLAKACGPNVRVNAISPSNIEAEARTAEMVEAAKQWPLRRLGKPEEVSGAALFLASDSSSFVTGQVLFVDGGRVATS